MARQFRDPVVAVVAGRFQSGRGRLEVGSTKNKDGRLFPFGANVELRAVLEAQRARTDELQREKGAIIPWVFHRDGRRIKDFRKVWKKACQAAGVPGRIPHDFRRSAVRNLERAGVSRSVAMKLTSHKTASVYQRYTIVSESDLAEGVANLEGGDFRHKIDIIRGNGQERERR